MKPAQIFAVFIVVTTSAFGLVGQHSQRFSPDEIEGRYVRGIEFNQITTLNAVSRTLNAAHVAGGIVTIAPCGAEPSHDLTPLGPTLRDALDSVVVADPQYRWYLDQGVVNFVPSNNESTLLDVRVANFKVESDETQDDIVRRLLALPEIGEGITRLHMNQGFTEIGIRPLERPGFRQEEKNNGMLVHVRNATVREVLNTVARAHGSAVWSYQEKHCNVSNEFTIRFLVW